MRALITALRHAAGLPAVALALVLCVGACAGGSSDADTTTSQPPPTISPTTTTLPEPEPIGPSVVEVNEPVLVSNQDGVFLIENDGAVIQLVAGPVADAVSDGHGGLVFQVVRGRLALAGYQGDPIPGDSTIIWWVPAGSSTPRELLVPSPGTGHSLSLHDAFTLGDSFGVVYQRHEGSIPFEDMRDSLRVYDHQTKAIVDALSVRGWEWNVDAASAGGDLVAATEFTLYGGGCRLFALDGSSVSRPGVPEMTDACDVEGSSCPTMCALSDDGSRVVFLDSAANSPAWDIVLRTVEDGVEIGRSRIEVGGALRPHRVDVAGDLVLVNQLAEDWTHRTAFVGDMRVPGIGPAELPVSGRARFAAGGIDIDGPITIDSLLAQRAGEMDMLSLRPNGLGIATFGEPAGEVRRRLEGLLGPPSSDSFIEGFDYHDLWWEAIGLRARFTTRDFHRTDGVEHFVGWGYAPPGGPVLETDEGITIGDSYDTLIAAHGDEVVASGYEDECRIGWFAVIEGEPGTGRIVVLLSGEQDTPGTVGSLEAGAGMGC